MSRMDAKGIDVSHSRKMALYLFFLVGIAGIYAIYIPLLMDYYIVRPEQSYFSFYQDNFTNTPYIFEGIAIGTALVMIYCLTLRAGISALAVSVFLFLLTHASYIKYINRRELLRLDDLRLTEAAGMAFGYFRFSLNRWLALLTGVLLFFVAVGFALDWFKKRMREASNVSKETSGRCFRPILCVRFMCVTFLCTALFLYTDYFLRNGNTADEVTPITDENNVYVLYRFLQNDRLSSIGAEGAEERYEFLLAQEPVREVTDREVNPNIIVIMNESWWNTDNIESERITFSQDPMGPYKELAETCSTGYVTTNVFGGGTIASEMEFLTGVNTKYFRADSAYAQIQGRRLPSLVDYFDGLDYETVAIHPYYGSFYSRESVYAAMGFDRVIFEDTMRYRDIYTRYISDESLAREIIAQMQEGVGPQFIWAVSMANHMRVLNYKQEPVETYTYPIAVTAEGLSEEDYEATVNYINGIYLANLAFSKLVDYFSEREQPTILLMFGDHCPGFSTETLELFALGDEEDEETAERLYSTPVIMWNNFSEERLCFSGESIYYLPETLIAYAGLPDSDMTRILRYVRSCFQTNSVKFVRGASGEDLRRCTEEQLRALSYYKAVQYDLLSGEGVCWDAWQPAVAGQ